jgi:putative endonuclease
MWHSAKMRPPKHPCVYILANRPNGTLYVGVTSDIYRRMAEHTQKLVPGFTKKYGIDRLVYYEHHLSMEDAIEREKQIKEWKRLWKLKLIEIMNPAWVNLFDPDTGDLSSGPFDASFYDPRQTFL